mmetsp:Transcript_24957/g.68803  ORF Transcript_24957/g.68803 Transcript_24957/m.68803 type:complete len:205 (+) Transcript_24957:679-1293(+)
METKPLCAGVYHLPIFDYREWLVNCCALPVRGTRTQSKFLCAVLRSSYDNKTVRSLSFMYFTHADSFRTSSCRSSPRGAALSTQCVRVLEPETAESLARRSASAPMPPTTVYRGTMLTRPAARTRPSCDSNGSGFSDETAVGLDAASDFGRFSRCERWTVLESQISTSPGPNKQVMAGPEPNSLLSLGSISIQSSPPNSFSLSL